jgi:hypothetical protein
MKTKVFTVSVASAVLSVVALGAPSTAAAPPPPPVLPHPPPIAATFTLQPDTGPVGTQVTIKGACGFAATQLLYGVSVQIDGVFHNIWIPTEFANVKPTPLTRFSITFTFPSFGNIPIEDGGLGNVPIVPGTYLVGAGCAPPFTFMPFQPFTVTAA